ncbi:hypothetical protein GE061_012074 [Apolygus lucorum]|uniref:Cathepsin propeptide inhibitor domain-containing protein n=1 Tax=Apolygus lucorum TaxID=248454 RepID=A0A8S9XTC0_APOLU|nr:hypothetical protein GE061_012074 [Apolygus lucorum]
MSHPLFHHYFPVVFYFESFCHSGVIYPYRLSLSLPISVSYRIRSPANVRNLYPFLFIMGVEEEFHDWKVKFNKTYKNPEEEERRKKLWLKTKDMVETHNEKFARGETTFSMGLNHFADLEPHEMHCGGVLRNN